LKNTVYLNGRFVNQEDAKISIADGGWLHGAGLFETIRAEFARPFRLESHVRRLMNSAVEILRPIDRADVPDEDTIIELLKQNELATARLRLTVSAGSMLEGPAGNREQMPLTVAVTAAGLEGYAESLYERGVHTVICDYRQAKSDPLAGHKCTAYLPRLLGLRQAGRSQGFEAIWFNVHNQLAEGSISNIFLVKSGELLTPPLDTPVLPGVARATVTELAAVQGLTLKEQALIIDDLLGADEVLLTNVIMQVVPVVKIEKHDVNGGRVGPIAKRLREAFRNLVRKECQR